MIKNISSNWIVTIFTIAATYFVTPFLIKNLGNEGFGIWNLITSITGYLNLLMLGFPIATVKFFSEHIATNNREKIDETVGTCLTLYCFMVLISILIGLALFFILFKQYPLPLSWRDDAYLAFLVFLCNISMGFVGILCDSIIIAHNDFIIRNAVSSVTIILRTVLILLIFIYYKSLSILSSIHFLCLMIQIGLSIFVIKMRYKDLKFNFKKFRLDILKQIMTLSNYIFILGIGGKLLFETAPLIIGAFLGFSQIPFYTIASSFFIYLIDIIIAIASVILVTASKLNASNNLFELRNIFLRWSKISFSISLLAGLFLMVIGPKFISWWISPTFEKPAGGVLRILMVSCILFLPVRGVVHPILMGLGRAKVPSVIFIISGVINVIISLILVKTYGLKGVALGTTLPLVGYTIIILFYMCSILKVPVIHYLKYTLIKNILGIIPFLIFLLWFNLETTDINLISFVKVGLLSSSVFICSCIFYIYKNDFQKLNLLNLNLLRKK